MMLTYCLPFLIILFQGVFVILDSEAYFVDRVTDIYVFENVKCTNYIRRCLLCTRVRSDCWMDDLGFYGPLNSISVILG